MLICVGSTIIEIYPGGRISSLTPIDYPNLTLIKDSDEKHNLEEAGREKQDNRFPEGSKGRGSKTGTGSPKEREES